MSSRSSMSASLPLIQASAATGPATRHQQLQDEVVALFDEFREPLLRYLSNFGLAVADAEEIVQEVFLSLFAHLLRDKPRDHLRGWLFRVAHNLALKRCLRMQRDRALRADATVEELAADAAENPEEHLLQGRGRQVVAAVVRALPERDRKCLLLRAEGLTYREIASVVGLSLAAVSLSLTRSLARISRATGR